MQQLTLVLLYGRHGNFALIVSDSQTLGVAGYPSELSAWRKTLYNRLLVSDGVGNSFNCDIVL